jgi:hypothetical protein
VVEGAVCGGGRRVQDLLRPYGTHPQFRQGLLRPSEPHAAGPPPRMSERRSFETLTRRSGHQGDQVGLNQHSHRGGRDEQLERRRQRTRSESGIVCEAPVGAPLRDQPGPQFSDSAAAGPAPDQQRPVVPPVVGH